MEYVTEEDCIGCPVYDGDPNRDNMIKNNICHKRNAVGCPKDEEEELEWKIT